MFISKLLLSESRSNGWAQSSNAFRIIWRVFHPGTYSCFWLFFVIGFSLWMLFFWVGNFRTCWETFWPYLYWPRLCCDSNNSTRSFAISHVHYSYHNATPYTISITILMTHNVFSFHKDIQKCFLEVCAWFLISIIHSKHN